MAKTKKRPSWFKVFLSDKPAFDAVSDEALGQGIKTALAYFEDGDSSRAENLSEPAYIVYSILLSHIEESWVDYDMSVEYGHKGSKERWGAPL